MTPLPHEQAQDPFHKIFRIAEEDIIPDGRYQSVAPSGDAPEGTQILYKSGTTVRLYKRIAGAWYYVALTAA
jgi:hypothetical protein